MIGPTAAKGTFPYQMRTVAEVDAAFAEPPSQFAWCAQCDDLVHKAAATFCAAPFCSLRKAIAA